MKHTVRSIAALAGVSRGTVSRVLNNQPDVSPEVRARVLRIIEETGYRRDERFAGGERICIGVIVAHWQNDYFINSTLRGIQRAAREINAGKVTLEIRRMNSRSDEEYIRVCEQLLEIGVRALVLNAPDNVIIAAEIERLMRAGIAVVTYNSDLPGTKRMCHVGQDLAKSGRIAAGLMARSLSSKDQVLVITGNMEFRSNRVRVDGFLEHMERLGFRSDSYILAECYERYDLTHETVCQALERNPRLHGIYMGTENVKACVDALKGVRRRMTVVANDLTPEAKHSLKKGKIDFVVEQDFSGQVYRAILILHELLVYGHRIRHEIVNVNTSIITRELL
ncbi:MAG: LacI family DNA-binding transcriptional regulator [Eubacteriales bacterium]|nr:LacI family DNA-binding transcriptional regulator [Eubacteriales bacterium]